MSLSSALFTGTSGLKNTGRAFQVTGNNISNLNTVGFKKGRASFADVLYQNVSTQAGAGQVGRGMALGDVSQNYSQGSFESTGNATDLSIGGNGFFILRQANTQNTSYTRAGNFRFNEKGQFVNATGHLVQGWNLDETTGDPTGSLTDLILTKTSSPPKKSSQVNVVANLNAKAKTNAEVLSSYFNGLKNPPVAKSSYGYRTTVKVYDALGSSHDINITYNKKSDTEWEYMVSMNPDEDKRNAVQGTMGKGLLARGTLKFSPSSGKVVDITMSKMTGRLGRFTATGENTVKDVNYKIVDSKAMTKDGPGFKLEYDGNKWSFADTDGDGVITSADLPPNYKNARIVHSDNQNVHIVLNPNSATDNEPDLKIRLKKPASATDSIGFNVNAEKDLHVQGISGTSYVGGADNDNTTMKINAPGVMEKDVDNVALTYNPKTGTWHWSNPEGAHKAGTLLGKVETNDPTNISTTDITVNNPQAAKRVVNGMKIRFNAKTGKWDWNQPLKKEDISEQKFSFTPANNPVLSIVSKGKQGAIASTNASGVPENITLKWDGTKWTADTGSSNTRVEVDTAASGNSQVTLKVYDGAGNAAEASVIRYSFGKNLTTSANQTIQFKIDPTPPQEYPDATITAPGTPADSVGIDLDNDKTTDLTFNVRGGGGAAPTDNDSLSFNLNPDTPPPEYANATLTGDKNKVSIDLDGSGNEDDKEDIVFNFKKALKTGETTHPYTDRTRIQFNIQGSTAWTQVSKEEIKEKGYFAFSADFLGGDFGSTKSDILLNMGTKFDGKHFVNDSMSTTQFAKASSTAYQDSDGYGPGDLQRVSVSSDGVITGIYSNGQRIPLFQVGLAKFRNNHGLSNTGGNRFEATRESGNAITNKPGSNGLGRISPNSLEKSNVEISEEFVSMITNQRAFQANSKTITTVDDMMQTVIQMKR
ncbi:MAG: flagellar hook-basal body complex protein [Desulfobacterales bacterium]|nr:flagellar hook-basal body complex protein [Desulfobacterales bacterium]